MRAAAREMQDAGAAFFGPAAADFVWVPATGGTATLIMPSAGFGNPHFTNEPRSHLSPTVVATDSSSFRWDGTDMKSHIKVTGPLPPQVTVSGSR